MNVRVINEHGELIGGFYAGITDGLLPQAGDRLTLWSRGQRVEVRVIGRGLGQQSTNGELHLVYILAEVVQ